MTARADTADEAVLMLKTMLKEQGVIFVQESTVD